MVSEVKKFFIEQHQDMPVKDLCKKTGLSEKTVKSVLEEVKPTPVRGKHIDQFMNKKAGTVAMTPDASERADSMRPVLKGKTVYDCVTKIRPDK